MAPIAVRQLSLPARLAALLLSTAACHEVLQIEPPPLERSSTVVVAAEGPGERLELFADTAALSAPPNLVLGGQARAWAFGFGCSLERLGLDRADLDPQQADSVPRLPPPIEAYLWTPTTPWRPTTAETTPPPLRDLFPRDGLEPCDSFVARPELQSARGTVLPLEEPELGSPFVTVVPLRPRGLLVLQPILERDQDDDLLTLVGGRLVRFDDIDGRGRVVPDIEGLSAPIALASRGEGEVVVVGFDRAVRGTLDGGFIPAPAFPDLQGYKAVRLAVSPVDEPFEAFVLARSEHPADRTATSTLTLFRVSEVGFETVYSRPVRPLNDRGATRPDRVVRTGPGEAFALGFSAAAELLRVRAGTAVLEPIDRTRGGVPIGLDQAAEVGVVVVDTEGSAFWRPVDHVDGQAWRLVHRRAGDFGPLGLTELDGVPTFAVYNAGSTGLAAGVRFVHARAPDRDNSSCSTDSSPVRPLLDFGLVVVDLIATPAADPRVWWFATSRHEELQLSQVTLVGGLGDCGRRAP